MLVPEIIQAFVQDLLNEKQNCDLNDLNVLVKWSVGCYPLQASQQNPAEVGEHIFGLWLVQNVPLEQSVIAEFGKQKIYIGNRINIIALQNP